MCKNPPPFLGTAEGDVFTKITDITENTNKYDDGKISFQDAVAEAFSGEIKVRPQDEIALEPEIKNTYERVWKQFEEEHKEEFKKIKIIKPELIFDKECVPESANFVECANYSPVDNIITVNFNALQVFAYGSREHIFPLDKASIISEISKKRIVKSELSPWGEDFNSGDKVLKTDLKLFKKLSPKESALLLESTLRHELEHCYQNHILLNTKGVSKSYKKQAHDGIKGAMLKFLYSQEVGGKTMPLTLSTFALKAKLALECINKGDYITNYPSRDVYSGDQIFPSSLLNGEVQTNIETLYHNLAQRKDSPNYNYNTNSAELYAHDMGLQQLFKVKEKCEGTTLEPILMILIGERFCYVEDNAKKGDNEKV